MYTYFSDITSSSNGEYEVGCFISAKYGWLYQWHLHNHWSWPCLYEEHANQSLWNPHRPTPLCFRKDRIFSQSLKSQWILPAQDPRNITFLFISMILLRQTILLLEDVFNTSEMMSEPFLHPTTRLAWASSWTVTCTPPASPRTTPTAISTSQPTTLNWQAAVECAQILSLLAWINSADLHSELAAHWLGTTRGHIWFLWCQILTILRWLADMKLVLFCYLARPLPLI